MATPILGVGIRSVQRPVSAGTAFGEALSERSIRTPGSEPQLTGSYVIIGPDTVEGHSTGPVTYGNVIALTPASGFHAGIQDSRVIVRRLFPASGGDVSAATLGAGTVVTVPHFYPNVALEGIESSWASSTGRFRVRFHDRRLEPFFERLSRIEQGEWDELRGRRPSATALANARQILARLKGDTLIPKKVVAADGRVVLYFTSGIRYSNIEVLNTGALLLVNSDGVGIPRVNRFKLSNLPSTINQIRAHTS